MRWSVSEQVFKESTKQIYSLTDIKNSEVYFYPGKTEDLAILVEDTSGLFFYFKKRKLHFRNIKKLEGNYNAEKNLNRIEAGDKILVDMCWGTCIYNITKNIDLTVFLASFPEEEKEWLAVVENKDEKFLSFIKETEVFRSMFSLRIYLNLIKPTDKKTYTGCRFITDLISVMNTDINVPKYIKSQINSYINGNNKTKDEKLNFNSLDKFIEEKVKAEVKMEVEKKQEPFPTYKIKLSELLAKGVEILKGRHYVEIEMDTNILDGMGIGIDQMYFINEKLTVITQDYRKDLHEYYLEKFKSALDTEDLILN